jgi:hypothetical protein
MSAAADRFLDGADEQNDNRNAIHGVLAVPLLALALTIEAAAPSVAADLAGAIFLALMFAEDKAGGDPHGLTVEEIGAIHFYTQETPFYGALNGALRDKDRSKLKPFFPYLKLLFTALHKLPRVRGLVHRGVRLPIDRLGYYFKGAKVLWWGFSSTTTDAEVLEQEQFLGREGGRTMFHLAVENGVSIRAYSSMAEEEVLLLPGTFLLVNSVTDLGHGLHMVNLAELPAPPLVDFARPRAPAPAGAGGGAASAVLLV